RKAAFQAQVLIVLRDRSAPAAETRGIVDRFLEAVSHCTADAAGEPPREPDLAHVHDRTALRCLVCKAGGITDLQALRGGERRTRSRAIGLAENVQRRALSADVLEFDDRVVREAFLNRKGPGLRITQPVIGV